MVRTEEYNGIKKLLMSLRRQPICLSEDDIQIPNLVTRQSNYLKTENSRHINGKENSEDKIT